MTRFQPWSILLQEKSRAEHKEAVRAMPSFWVVCILVPGSWVPWVCVCVASARQLQCQHSGLLAKRAVVKLPAPGSVPGKGRCCRSSWGQIWVHRGGPCINVKTTFYDIYSMITCLILAHTPKHCSDQKATQDCDSTCSLNWPNRKYYLCCYELHEI